jgi:hypothetical protein
MMLFLLVAVASAFDYGIVNLDNYTMPLLVGKSVPALVRIDREYPYGDSNDAFKDVAVGVTESGSDLLMGHVGVSTWGDRNNNDLAVKYAGVPESETLEYSSMDTYFPKFILFPKDKGAEVPYTGATDNKDNLKSGLMSLMKRYANIYFGLPGCIQELDTIAGKFKGAPDAALTEAKAAVEKMDADGKAKAEYYLKAMEKGKAKGHEHFAAESKRLEGLMGGSIAGDKKKEMQKKLNILASFV